MLIFKKILWRNLLSTGSSPNSFELNSHSSTLIAGKNGCGKCLHPTTLIDIEFEDEETRQKFIKFLTTTI